MAYRPCSDEFHNTLVAFKSPSIDLLPPYNIGPPGSRSLPPSDLKTCQVVTSKVPPKDLETCRLVCSRSSQQNTRRQVLRSLGGTFQVTTWQVSRSLGGRLLDPGGPNYEHFFACSRPMEGPWEATKVLLNSSKQGQFTIKKKMFFLRRRPFKSRVFFHDLIAYVLQTFIVHIIV